MKIKIGAICPHCRKERLPDVEVVAKEETRTTRTCSRCRTKWIVVAREISSDEKKTVHVLEWTVV